jgi:hypothetical protein
MVERPAKQKRRWWINPLPDLPPEECHPVAGGPITKLEIEVFSRFADAGWFYRAGIQSELGEVDLVVFWDEEPNISIIAWLPAPYELSFDWCIKLSEGELEITSSDDKARERLLEGEALSNSIRTFMENSAYKAQIGTNYVRVQLYEERNPWGSMVNHTIASAVKLAAMITSQAQRLNLLKHSEADLS